MRSETTKTREEGEKRNAVLGGVEVRSQGAGRGWSSAERVEQAYRDTRNLSHRPWEPTESLRTFALGYLTSSNRASNHSDRYCFATLQLHQLGAIRSLRPFYTHRFLA